jgi:Peptidase family M23
VTQYFNPPTEYGTDFGVPFHTPIPDVLAGVVERINCAVGYRCEVDIASSWQGQPVTESYLHIDQPAVRVGQQLGPGDLIGLSGGQLSGGSNPDDPRFSTGPHVEFDIFRGGPFQNPIDPLTIARGGPGGVNAGGPSVQPGDVLQEIISALTGGAGAAAAQAAAPQVNAAATGLGLASIGQAINDLPTSIGHGLANAFGASVHDVAAFAQNQAVPLIVALVVALVIFGGAL